MTRYDSCFFLCDGILIYICIGHDVIVVDNLSRRKIDIDLGCSSLTPIQSPEIRLKVRWDEERRKKRFEGGSEGTFFFYYVCFFRELTILTDVEGYIW